MSISRTVEEAPMVLKEELNQLLEGMKSKPNSLEPYLAFFERLDVPDVKSTMKMEDYLAEYDLENIGDHIAYMLKTLENAVNTIRGEKCDYR